MKDLTLTAQDQARLQILNHVVAGECTAVEAAGLLGRSVRQVWRLLAAYRVEGAAALVHGNRGRAPAHTLSEPVRQRVRELAATTYAGLNYSHLTDLLAEREDLRLSRSTVRRLLVADQRPSPRTRRPPLHRLRRERMGQEGMLLQLDGSQHAWLQDRGPRFTLLAAIDDATGTVPAVCVREQEDAHGYFLLLQTILASKGIPLALYSDRHGIFQRSPREPETLDEQLDGVRQPTQFGRALRDLAIQPILAQSPEAKGRIERLWGTLQDRLVGELRLAGASTAAEATALLTAFLPRFNARFGVPPALPGSAYRPVAPGLCVEGILCFTYLATVARDNTVRFAGQTLQLLPSRTRRTYAHRRVEVQERLDGSIIVVADGETLASRAAPAEPAALRARDAPRGTGLGPIKQPKPPSAHPWRTYRS
ncbi:MAG TPA: ISNCY family transposase [Dehalococcoidia bacterium]|nr:ISNCY family transposase [Dehalococcoidia bacterium]